jgi:8-oxo-dGTP pyrophosphatase MutT (NUDIX family)
VLFIRHTYGDRRLWELPGGGIARGETPQEAVVREAHEELGVALSWVPVAVLEIRDRKTNELHVFTAGAGSASVTIDPGEIAEARWAPPGDPPRPLSPSTAAILEL